MTTPVRRRRPTVLVTVAAAWALALAGTGVWYSFHGKPSVRDQTTIGAAQSTVDTALGRVIAAAGGEPVPVLSSYHKTSDCDVTPVRAGVRYQRSVRLYTGLGGEVALLDRIARGLPRSYGAHAGGTTVRTLYADAGYYVGLTGTVPEPGVVEVAADTGCRTLGRRPATDPTVQPADRGPLDQLVAAIADRPAVLWSTHALPCGVRTVEADVPAGPLPLSLPLATPPLLQRDDVVAAHEGGVGVVVRSEGDRIAITATTGTCG